MSVYNDIYILQRAFPCIVVDCNPDQFTRDTTSLDQEDFQKLLGLAVKLGWIKGQWWTVQPWFDEGDDRPEEPGPKELVEAENKDEAEQKYLEANPTLTSVAWLDVENIS